jgi:heat shock protein HtpX
MNTLKTFTLVGILMALFVWVGYVWGGPQGATIALFLSLAMNFVTFWWSDKIVLAMYHARPVERGDNPRLLAIVEELAREVDLPTPKVYVIPSDAPNAFATGRGPHHAAVAVTEGLLRIMNDDELAGVIAHELGHVRHRDILTGTIVASVVGAISWISVMARWAMIFGGGRRSSRNSGNAVALLVIAILAPILAMVLQAMISRRREFAADRAGAENAGTPQGLMSALGKLEAYSRGGQIQAGPATAHMFIMNPLSARGFSRLFSTHPPVEERIEALRRLA